MSRPGSMVFSNVSARNRALESSPILSGVRSTEEINAYADVAPQGLSLRRVNDGIADAIERRNPPLDPYRDGRYGFDGAVWWISLTGEQTRRLQELLAAGGGALAAIPGFHAIAVQLEASAAYIWAVNELSGNRGVTINGRITSVGVVVTPHWGPLFDTMVHAARLGVSGRTITEFLVQAAAHSPVIAEALRIPVVAQVFGAVLSGTPLGWALAGAMGLAVDLLMPAPNPNEWGAVHANRSAAHKWEAFWLGSLGGDRVALLSWQGHFSAQFGGGAGVYANRPLIGEWETWKLIRNADGTISLQTFTGHFLCAEAGGGRECQANRTVIGDWEKFHLVHLPEGQVALKTKVSGQFVSVQDRK
jgi:hypothetical protein